MEETVETRKPGDGCKGCFFRRKLGTDTACFYAIIMDKPRGCAAGAECTHYRKKSYPLRGNKRNCANCGAPVSRRSSVCEYCGTEG